MSHYAPYQSTPVSSLKFIYFLTMLILSLKNARLNESPLSKTSFCWPLLFSVDEPLFVKLSSSPAHRRTVALAILSAQSSLEDSSSIASRSRSVSPLRSQRHGDALLIGLSTGLFDTNNPKVSTINLTATIVSLNLLSFFGMLVQTVNQWLTLARSSNDKCSNRLHDF